METTPLTLSPAMLPIKTLKRQGDDLANPSRQLEVLRDPKFIAGGAFEAQLTRVHQPRLRRQSLQTLQINVGRVCNQTCSHCHVDAGPDRKEQMSRQSAEHVIEFLANSDIETLDITGGAPEMNPQFRWLVEQATGLNRRVIDRCNLTILLAKGFQDLPEFLADHQVHIIASLPCYLEENCDSQRGDGVFAKSIGAIRRLNQLGYSSGNGLVLDLVYNPVGDNLPPDQSKLEAEYREQLQTRYAISFDNLLAITNMPISRFLADLIRRGQYLTYMEKLRTAFNPSTIDGLMCRSMISVDWNGYLYDCDFNQMLELQIDPANATHISDVRASDLIDREIRTANHCFGCTAGAGSSCTGSVLT